MAALPLVFAPDPRLKAKCTAVETVDDDIRSFLDDMVDTMYAEDGVGLAAPQVGVTQRMLVIDTASKDEEPNPIKMINPEIIAASDIIVEREEGCLSLPKQWSQVARPETVRVRWLDEQGEIREMDCEGLTAVCVQHEIDHLDGTLFVDHLTALKRNMILRKLKKLMKDGAPA